MKTALKIKLFLVIALCVIGARAQTGAISWQAIDQYGQPLPHAQVRVCSATSTGTPCNPTVPIYQDYNLTVPVSNPYASDQFGNFSFYVPALSFPNIYLIQLFPASGTVWSYLINGPGGTGGSGCITGGTSGTLLASNGAGGCISAFVQVNGANLTSAIAPNFVDSPTVTVSNPGTNQVSFAVVPGTALSLSTNSTPNISQALLNFTDTATIHFTNPSGGVESATCATATGSTIGCTDLVNFKHTGTLLTGPFAATPQIYDYDESSPAADGGYVNATGRFDTATGKWNVEVPLIQLQIQPLIQLPDDTHQYYIIYPTVCTHNDTGFGRILSTVSCPGSSPGSATFQQQYLSTSFPPTTSTVTFSGWSLPASIPAGNVTGVYAAAYSSTDGFGNNFSSRTCSGVDVLPTTTTWLGTQVTNLTGLTGATIGSAACSLVAVNSSSQPGPSTTNVDAVVLIVQYTGTVVPQPSYLNVAWPLSLNTSTNTLGIDLSFPGWTNAITVAQFNQLSSVTRNTTLGYYAMVDISDGSTPTDCSVGGGSNRVKCYFNGTAWVAWNPGGGGSGTVTNVATDATLTGGPITTTGTLGLNLAHTNTWTAKQTQPAPLFSDLTGLTQCLHVSATGQVSGTGSDCGAGSGGLTSLNSQTGPSVTLQSSGATVAITTPSSNVINLEATGSGTPLVSRVSCVTYGCVADGNLAANTGTDNTTPFTNCLTAAIAAKGVCYIPSGVYRIATSLPTISVGGTGFVGDTWGYDTSVSTNWNGPSTTIFSSSASATILSITNASIITGDTLQNISLQRAVSPGAGSIALLMNNAAGAWINRNEFNDSAVGLDLTSVPSFGLGIFEHNVAEWGFAGIGCIPSGSMIGFNLHGGGGGFFSLYLQWNSVANNCGAALTSYGFKGDGALADLNMSNNQTAGTGYGVYMVGTAGQDMHIVDQTDDGNLIQCEHFDFGGGGEATELRGGWCETGHGTSGGTELHNVRNMRVSNRQYLDLGGSLPQGVLINTGSTANAIQNNTFYQPFSVAIVCNGANSNNYSGNTFDLQGAASEAMDLTNCSNNSIMSNKASTGTGTVIKLNSASNNNLWVNMNSWESSGTAVSDAGTGNQFTTPVATGSTFGTIKPDGATCTVTAGVLTCPGSSSSYSVLPAPPALAGFSWVNQLSATATQGAFNAINVIIPNQGSLNWQLLKTATPSTPWSAQMFSSNVQGVATGAAGNWGMYLYDGTKLEGIENLYNGGSNCSILPPGCLRVERMNSVTSDNSSVLANTQTYGVLPQSGWYLRWCDSGTTLYAEWSQDGSVWNVLYSEPVGAFITPTAVGFGGLNLDGTPNNVWGSVKGWQITSGATCP